MLGSFPQSLLYSHSFHSVSAPASTPASALSVLQMPPLSAPTNWRQDPSLVPMALVEARSFLCGSHKSVGSDEIKAVGSQFPEFISYPDTFDLEDDNSTRRISRSESGCIVSEASLLDFFTSDLESDTSQVVTPIPQLNAIHRSAYITQADFDELQRQRLGKRKRTHSSGMCLTSSLSFLFCTSTE
jgi:hypothetical protein